MAVIENSTFESTVENHVSWFSCTVARDNGAAHGGTWSLLCSTTAASGSGVQLDNFPYFSGITAGNSYDFELWYIESTATMPTVTWNIRFYDNGGTQVGTTETVSMPRATVWTRVTGTFTAPTGALRVGWTFEWSTGGSGPAFRIDDLLSQDAVPTATAPPFYLRSGAASSLRGGDALRGSLTGTAFTQTVTDSAGLTDTRGHAVGLAPTDSAGLTDTRGHAVALERTDPQGLTDTFSAGLVVALALIDDAGLSDPRTVSEGHGLTQDDNTGLTDTRALAVGLERTDPAGLTDTRAHALGLERTDSAGLTDSQTVTSGKVLDLTDDSGLTDTRAHAVGLVRTDDTALTDQALTQFSGVYALTLDDSAGLSDPRSLERGLALTDNGGLTDTRTLSQGFGRTVDDTTGLTDTRAFTAAWVRAFTDDTGLLDLAVLARTITATLTDLVGLTDEQEFGGGEGHLRPAPRATGNLGRGTRAGLALSGAGRGTGTLTGGGER